MVRLACHLINFIIYYLAQKKMKKNLFSNVHLFLPIKLAILFLVLLSGCKGEEQVVPSLGLLSVYNVSPTFATYDVMVNNKKLNTADLPFGGGIGYTEFTTGTYQIKFSTAGVNDNILTKSGVSIAQNAFNTLYFIGTSGNFDALVIADNFPNTDLDKAHVRFINLSPDAPALDLGIKDVSAALTTNKTYKSYSNFIAVDEGAKVFEIKETSSGTVKTTLESTTLVKGYFYTIVSRGKISPIGSLEKPFSGQVILHK